MSNLVQPLSPAQTANEEAKADAEPILEQDAVAVDKAFAKIVLNAPPDVTVSEQAGVIAYKYPKGGGIKGWYGRTMSRFLNFFQRNHGADATAGGNAEALQAIQYGNESGLLNEEKR
ncbi:hypothetical protein KGP36_06050 [Patescibacteria group bacterium]|nr:hypothetical protein [Patescibacteria group bacterium]